MSTTSIMSDATRHAYLLALATWMNSRDMRLLHEELAEVSRRGDEEARQGFVAAIEYLSDGSLQMDVGRVNRHVQMIIRRDIIHAKVPSMSIHPQADHVPLIRISLCFDAPWMKAKQELNLEVGLDDILRAFAPFPAHHYAMPSLDDLHHYHHKQLDRLKYTDRLTQEIMRGLRRMVESGDPLLGIYPKNIKV